MGIDLQQRRIVIGIILVTLAICALFLAQGTTNLLATTLLPLEGTRAIAQPPAGSTRERSAVLQNEKHDIKGILKRNIFDSQTGPLWPPPLDPELPTPEDESATEEAFDPNVLPPACEGSIELVAAVVSTRRPDWSFAALQGSEGKTLLYREGTTVDDHEVAHIYPNAVYLRPSSGMCSLTLFEDPSQDRKKQVKKERPKPKSRHARRRRASRRGSSISDEMLEEGIEKKSETKYVIARSLVDTVLQNQAELMRTARIIPHEQGGQVVGVKLYGIRRNSLLGKLGINNGDVLRTINGYDMTSPDTALEAYARLRSADQLTVSVQRRGRAMNLEYDIQ